MLSFNQTGTSIYKYTKGIEEIVAYFTAPFTYIPKRPDQMRERGGRENLE
jgi:hypothetical protein